MSDIIARMPQDESKESWRAFLVDYIRASDIESYYETHIERYCETIGWIPVGHKDGARAIELGSSPLFQELLRHRFGFEEVHGTVFSDGGQKESFFRKFDRLGDRPWYMAHPINFEQDSLPFPDSYFDFVMACEVVEHMEIDPMFLMSEINRVTAFNGRLLVTTPNSTSSRILWSILNGFRPHFYMQYPRDRSLYKHNFEYDVPTARLLVESAGFTIERIETKDCFAPPVTEALELLDRTGFTTENRGDNIFILARKTGPVTNRHPVGIYQ